MYTAGHAGATHPQARNSQDPRQTHNRTRRTEPHPEPLLRAWPCRHLDLGLWPPGLRANEALCVDPRLTGLSYDSPRTVFPAAT